MKTAPIVVVAAVMLACAGCGSGSNETTAKAGSAAVEDGDYLVYSIRTPQGTINARLILHEDADGYVVEMPIEEEPDVQHADQGFGFDMDYLDDEDDYPVNEEELGLSDERLELDSRFHPRYAEDFEAYFIGRLWVSPDEAVETVKWGKWDAFPVKTSGNVDGTRYYHAETGFLVGYRLQVAFADMEATLTDTSIDALD